MAERVNVIIDRDMLIGELYNLRKFVEPDQDELKDALQKLVDLVVKAPSDERKSAYPRIKGR